jgi:hypothetical protein
MSEDRSRTMGRIVRTVAVATLAMSCTAHAADTPAPSDWPIASRDYAGWRFADLGDINAGNVANLKVAFTFSTGVVRGHEAAPVVAGGTMYIITPYPNVVYALDLTKPGAPVKWQFEPKPLAASQGVACCDVVSGGLPVHERPRAHDAERLMGHQRLRFRGVVLLGLHTTHLPTAAFDTVVLAVLMFIGPLRDLRVAAHLCGHLHRAEVPVNGRRA